MSCVGERVAFPSEPSFDRGDRTDKRQIGKTKQEGGWECERPDGEIIWLNLQTLGWSLHGHGRACVVLTFLLGLPTPSAAETMGPTYSWLLALMTKSDIRKIWPVSGWARVRSQSLRIRNGLQKHPHVHLSGGEPAEGGCHIKSHFSCLGEPTPMLMSDWKQRENPLPESVAGAIPQMAFVQNPVLTPLKRTEVSFFPDNGFYHSVSGKLFHSKKMPKHFQQCWKK